jgi:hypothetical protein
VIFYGVVQYCVARCGIVWSGGRWVRVCVFYYDHFILAYDLKDCTLLQ